MISLGENYLIFGIILAAMLVTLISLVYFVFYKRIFRGRKTISKSRVIWFIVFVCYLAVIFGATMLNRVPFYDNSKINSLFYSYREAWVNFRPRDWRNIILNIALFVPFGFLLPFGIQRLRKFWITYLIGFFISLGIESIQYGLKIGLFELDDIMDNTIGMMIGYGCFALLSTLILSFKGKKYSLKKTAALQLPLIIMIVIFASIFTVYARQDLGNLSVEYISKIDPEILSISSDEFYNTERVSSTVYKTKRFTQLETYQYAKKIFESVGDTMDESRTQIYDETAVYNSFDGYSFWMDYLGGTYHISDFNADSIDYPIDAVLDATEEDIVLALGNYGIELPDGMEFTNEGEGNYTLTANGICMSETIYDGTISCTYYENGKMGSITSNLILCEYYKDCDIISEEEAFEMIEDGKFSINSNSDELSLHIVAASLKYMVDSKAYYQPVYAFEVEVDGWYTVIYIPAIS